MKPSYRGVRTRHTHSHTHTAHHSLYLRLGLVVYITRRATQPAQLISQPFHRLVVLLLHFAALVVCQKVSSFKLT